MNDKSTGNGLGKIKNIEDLRDSLIDAYERLNEGLLTTGICKQMNSFAKNVVDTCKVQLLDAHQRGVEPKIPFLTDIEDEDVKKIESGKK